MLQCFGVPNGEKTLAVIKRGPLHSSDSSRKALKHSTKYTDPHKRPNTLLASPLLTHRKSKHLTQDKPNIH